MPSMSRRQKRTLAIVTCLVAAALVPPVSRLLERAFEPHYQGQPLSFWMAQLAKDRVEEAEFQQATNAISHIGVAALPRLVKRLQYKQPQWKVNLAVRLSQSRLLFAGKLYDWTADRRPQQLADATYFGFQVLGKRAMPAFGELCQIMNNSKDPVIAGRAAMALGCLGTNALPSLLEVLANPQHPAQLDAGIALGMMSEVLEALQLAASGAASFLGMTNTEPTLIAINSALMQKGFPQVSTTFAAASMVRPSVAAKVRALETSAGFGPKGSNAIAALSKALDDPDMNVRRYATNALLMIGPDALTNLPAR
jgi:hypothetical protein